MTKILLFALAGFLLYIGDAKAGFGDANNVNCAALTGTPLMCIKNQTSAPVVGVQAVNLGSMFVDSNWVNING